MIGHRYNFLADNINRVTDFDRRFLQLTADRTCVVARKHNIPVFLFGDRSFAVSTLHV